MREHGWLVTVQQLQSLGSGSGQRPLGSPWKLLKPCGVTMETASLASALPEIPAGRVTVSPSGFRCIDSARQQSGHHGVGSPFHSPTGQVGDDTNKKGGVGSGQSNAKEPSLNYSQSVFMD